MSSPLVATRPIAPDHRTPPVVVIGLPRSGSSFLSHVMSALDDWYVFDDLYLYRQARAIGANGALRGEQLEKLIDFLGWQLRARIQFESDFARPECSLDDVSEMNAAMLETFRETPVHWHELMEEWLVRLALHHGRSRWGYKAPQDFMQMEMLAGLFPGIRFVFILRDPRDTMSSFKFVDGEDGRPGQYHPWVYARYWRMANQRADQNARTLGVPMLRVRFEDLVGDPRREGQRLADFLDTKLSGELPGGANTSFREGDRKTISETERWICERVAGNEMDRQGYDRDAARFRIRDLPDLAATTLRFASHQTRRLWKNPAARTSVTGFLRNLGRS
ncbi:MAG: sulfotransferase [Deltaproteobacteria bacterium]|nr:sulfotransferase [Deltaproteobacteria bacterium]